MLKMNTAVVLAGGKSSRMLFDKQSVSISGRLIAVFIADILSQEFDNVIIISNKPSLYKDRCPYKIIPDDIHASGPKAGLLTGLNATSDDFVYFTGCDMPFVNIPFIKYMKKQISNSHGICDVVLGTTGEHFEPLNAFYSKSLAYLLKTQLLSGNRKVSEIYNKSRMILLDEPKRFHLDPDNLMYVNLNTIEDFEKYILYGDYQNFISL